MNIIFASYACCIRTIKEGIALMQQGHAVTFLQKTMANWELLAELPVVSFFGNPFKMDESPEYYMRKLKMFQETDLIHVHNEPSWLGHKAKEACPDIPVIFDAHDLNLVRQTIRHNPEKKEATKDEIKSFKMCDGVIFPSVGYQEYCKKYKALVYTPTEVIYSMVNKHVLHMPGVSRLPGIVYQGGLTINNNYRDYRQVASILNNMKIPFHIYDTTMNYMQQYTAAGAICMPTQSYYSLIRNLNRYDWGFVGSPIKSSQWDRAMPNKMFEFIAAGIPCLVYQANECAEFVKKHNLGIVVDDLRDIPSIYDQHEKYRKIVMQKRDQFTMESQTEKILTLYEKVLHGK